MPAVTPSQLLKVLAPLLDKSGGMKDVDSASRIVSLMKDCTKLVSKCVYVNICLHTSSEDVLQKFISNTGWTLLYQWLQEAKEVDNMVFVLELLKVYQRLPVTVDDLKKDDTARFIKRLTKHDNEDVQNLSTAVVDNWMKKIKGRSNNHEESDKSKKKKKKDKDRDKEKEKDKDKEKEKDKDKDKEKEKDKEREKDKDKDRHRHRSSDKKDSSHHNSHRSHSSKKDSSSSDKKSSSSASDSSHKPRHGSDSKEDNSENAESRLTEEGVTKSPSQSKPNNSGKEEEEDKTRRKPKTARVFTSKFRSVFDEDDPLPPIKKKSSEEMKPPLSLPKRVSDPLREEPMEKIPRLTLKINPTDPSSSTVSPTSPSPPEVTHGRIKIIPAKRPPAHEIHDSNVFMNELTKSSYTHGTMKRKKKPTPTSSALPLARQPAVGMTAKTMASTAPTTPTTPTTPTAPTTSPTSVVPSTPPIPKVAVPSFYRDTLEEAEEVQAETSKEERSPPSLEKMETNDAEEVAMDEEGEDNSEPPTIDMENNQDTAADSTQGSTATTPAPCEEGEGEDVQMKEEGAGDRTPQAEDMEQAEDPTDNVAQEKTNKKRVRWAEESSLRQIFYFELDETERENVNRPKTFNELKKQDMRSEGRAMETAKRLINDNMVEVLPWRRPPMIDNLTMTVELGCNSVEKGIQQQRESGVLQALFFSKQMLPDSPSEPELESVEPSDTKIIPLVDETSSGEEFEHTYNVDPAAMPYDPGFDITQNFNPAGGANNSRAGGSGTGTIQLPPDVNNMLASIQQQSIATGGQSLQANSAVMANVQSILGSIMHGGPNTNSEELINKLRVALEPLKNQIHAGPMQGMNQSDGQFQPQGPQGPQRHGLLGNAPPGFNPMMGPRHFGPQGQMMGGGSGGGGMEGDWNNMNMGNMQGPDMGMRGPMGPGFHPMQGPMQGPGPGMGGNGPVMPGPRMRNNRRGPDRRPVCRHFVAATGCRFGNACAFLHPGVNGPPINH